jgi:hypothetical protein
MKEIILSRIDIVDGHWIWNGCKNLGGYGYFTVGRQVQLAHRASYEAFVGPIPKGLVIDHLCRIRPCVNPEHMEVVTHKTNTLRGVGPAAKNAIKTQCPKGHPFDESNTQMYLNKETGSWARLCKACRGTHNKEYGKKYYQRVTKLKNNLK